MKKTVNVFLVILIAFFSFPIGGKMTLADGKDYSNIKDGEYKITFKTLHETKDEESSAASFIDPNAILSIKNGNAFLTVTLNSQDWITLFQVEGKDNTKQVVSENGETRAETFELTELKQMLNARVKYEVTGKPVTGDHQLRLSLEGLDDLPIIEEAGEPKEPAKPVEPEAPEEPETEKPIEEDKPAEDKEPSEKTGGLITNPDNTKEYQYNSDKISMLGRYFTNPVSLIEKDGKKYIQMNGNSAQFITSLTIDGEEVTWGKIADDHTYTFQFEVTKPLAEELDFGMVIDTQRPGMGKMTHNVKLWFEEIAEGLITNPDKKETIYYHSDNMKRLENHFENPVSLLHKDGKKYIQVNGSSGQMVKSLTINGEEVTRGKTKDDGTYTFQFELTGNLADKLDFNMTIDTGNPKFGTMEHGAKLWFDTKEQANEVPGGKPREEEPAKPIEKADADKQYTIHYDIKQDDGKKLSTADQYFKKPALLLEKDGQLYVQLTITEGDMVKDLKSGKQDATIVKKNKDGSLVVQLKVDQNLSDLPLSMRIVVPAFPGFPGYDSLHDALLVFDNSTKKEINPGTPPKNDPPAAKIKQKPKQNTLKEQETVKASKAYTIGYVIKQDNGVAISVADQYFKKPALLLEKDGQLYVQLTITEGDMVRDLKSGEQDAIIVKRNKDGSLVVQFKVDQNLSNLPLSMRIVVPAMPGFAGYDSAHHAILVFDKDSKKEISVSDGHQIVVKGEKVTSNNGKQPEKPGSFGENGDGTNKGNGGKAANPQTGDKSKIFLYSFLLFASLISLVTNIRRRFA